MLVSISRCRDQINIVLEDIIECFIRAKGAIFSAIHTMLTSLDMDVDVLEHIYVAGGIGSGINMDNAVRIGMFPNVDRGLFPSSVQE